MNPLDPSDRYDLDREWEIAPTPDALPSLAETMPDATDIHPSDCPCQPCAADREYADWIDENPGCECELDYRCGACGPGYTPIELANDAWAKSEGDLPWWAQ